MTGQPATAFAIPSHVLIQQLPDGEAVLLDLQTEKYFSLDPVGNRMLQELVGGASVDEACGALVAEFDVDPATLRRDLDDLILRLQTENLLAVPAT